MEQILYCLKIGLAECGTSKLQQKVAKILHWHLVANIGIKSDKMRVRKPQGKSGKMQHKQIMAMIGISFHNNGLNLVKQLIK